MQYRFSFFSFSYCLSHWTREVLRTPVRSHLNLAHVLCYCAYIISYVYCKQNYFVCLKLSQSTGNQTVRTLPVPLLYNLEEEKPKTITLFLLWQKLT